MNTPDNFLENLQQAVERYLNLQKIFKEIPVLSHQESNFESCLTEFVTTGVGLCILVLNPIPLRIIPGKDRVAFEDIQIRVQVIESPCTNQSGLSTLSVAEHVSQCLHHFQPTLDGWKGWLLINENHPWKELKDPQKTGRYILEITFQAKGSTTTPINNENYY